MKSVVRIVVSLLIGTVCVAEPTYRIELDNGRVVYAAIRSCADGKCIVENRSMGKFEIAENRIEGRADRPGPSSVPLPDPSAAERSGEPLPAAMADLRKDIESDPETMAKIRELEDDPQFQQALRDPEVVRAIQEGNFSTLMQNPQIQKLMEHPAVRDIQQRHQ